MSNPLNNFQEYMLDTYLTSEGWEHVFIDSSGMRTELWREDEFLGRGGYGEVRREKEDGGAVRAVKKISKAEDTGWSSLKELQAFTLLKDYPSYFVKFHGWWDDRRDFYLAMEYVPGGNLMSYIRSAQITEDGARNITRQLLEAVKILHENNICHRDLKPENVLMSSLPPDATSVKITDFGCSKQGIHTQLKSLTGTPGYMAPEILEVENSESPSYTKKVDIWSLGSITYTIMTKEPPLQATPTYRAYLKDTSVFPKEKLIASGTSQEGISFILSLMLPRPEDRFTAEQALKDPWLRYGKEGEPDQQRNSGGAPGVLQESLNKNPLEELGSGIQGNRNITSSIMACAGYPSLLFIPLFITGIQPDIYRRMHIHYSPPHVLVYTPPTDICQPRHQTAEKLFVEKDTCTNREGQRLALQVAVENGPMEVVESILREGADTVAEKDGRSVIHWAVNRGSRDITELLLRYGADPTSIDRSGATALHSAALNGYRGIVKSLLEYGANIIAKDSEGKTPLHLAATNNHEGMVRLLVERGAGIVATDHKKQTVLHAVTKGGGERIMELLLEKGVKISERDYWGRTALHLATRSGNDKSVRFLLGRGADITTVDYNGSTTLHLAVELGDEKITRVLLNSGANVMATDNLGVTVLHAATQPGGEQIMRLLLMKGADVLAADSRGRTALHVAARSGDQKIVRLLLEKGIDANAQEQGTGRTALHLATIKRDAGIVRLLLEGRNYLLGVRDHNDYQPLHITIYNQDLQIAKILLENGAIRVMRDHGSTALGIAESSGQMRMKQLLLEYGARNVPVYILDAHREVMQKLAQKFRREDISAFFRGELSLDESEDYETD